MPSVISTCKEYSGTKCTLEDAKSISLSSKLSLVNYTVHCNSIYFFPAHLVSDALLAAGQVIQVLAVHLVTGTVTGAIAVHVVLPVPVATAIFLGALILAITFAPLGLLVLAARKLVEVVVMVVVVVALALAFLVPRPPVLAVTLPPGVTLLLRLRELVTLLFVTLSLTPTLDRGWNMPIGPCLTTRGT